jgi:hypothetical protein
VDVAANHGQVASYLSAIVNAGIPANRGDISCDRRPLLRNHVPVNRSDIAGHVAANVDGAVEAGRVPDFVLGLDPNVMVDLEAVSITFGSGGKHCRGHKKNS